MAKHTYALSIDVRKPSNRLKSRFNETSCASWSIASVGEPVLVADRHRDSVFHAALHVVHADVVAEDGERVLAFSNPDRRAGEADERHHLDVIVRQPLLNQSHSPL